MSFRMRDSSMFTVIRTQLRDELLMLLMSSGLWLAGDDLLGGAVPA